MNPQPLQNQPVAAPTVPPASPAHMLGSLQIKNTSRLLTKDTRLATLIVAQPKFGKTTMAASLDKLCREHLQKPALFVALESSDGGGTMSIRKLGVDYIEPDNYDTMQKTIEALIEDTTYGGVVIDSATEYIELFLKPYALKFPSRERTALRGAGVPERSDYQTMGEKMRQDFNRLLKMTKHPDPRKRKHLVITALEKERTDDAGSVTAIVPNLPGAMANAATAMFQTVGNIKIVTTVGKGPDGKPTRESARWFSTASDGVRVAGDRFGVLPLLVEPDLSVIWNKYMVPAMTD